MHTEKIVAHYDSCLKDYKRVWHLDRCMAMHMGFWDEETTRLRDALINENRVLAEQAAITSTDHVLDAGCGVGGSAVFLAKQYGCHVTGITLSGQQVQHALRYAIRHNVEKLTTFLVADFTRMPYPDASLLMSYGLLKACAMLKTRKIFSKKHTVF